MKIIRFYDEDETRIDLHHISAYYTNKKDHKIKFVFKNSQLIIALYFSEFEYERTLKELDTFFGVNYN